jgi:hypothetical protein
MTQIDCIPLHYNHQTRLTPSGHISQSIVPLRPKCLVCKNKTQLYVYVLFLQVRKSSLLTCASLNQTAKLGMLDLWIRTDRCTEISVTTHQCCITSQKSKDLFCSTAEAWYYACYYYSFLLSRCLHILTSANGNTSSPSPVQITKHGETVLFIGPCNT